MTTTGHPRYGAPLRADPAIGTRPRLDATTIAAAARRLTSRDRWLLTMLAEHHTLTSTQITELAFGAHSATNRRLQKLHQLRAIDRFRPFTPTGSAPWHYILGDAGAAVLAADTGTGVKELVYRRRDVLAIAHSPELAHLVGTNGFFTALAAHARRTTGSALLTWWPDHRCATAWGHSIRPDGFGRWTEHDHQVDFFLEHDTGTETLHRLTGKLLGYLRLAATTGITTPVLFWLANPDRETHLHRLLTHPAIPVATAASTTGTPAGPIWRRAGRTDRVRLAQLATTAPAPRQASCSPKPPPSQPPSRC